MADLLTVETVEAYTGVTVDAADLDRLERRAVALAEAVTGLTLVATVRTERLRSGYDGWVYVAGPVTAAADSDGDPLDVEPHRIFFGRPGEAEVSVTVGYTAGDAPGRLLHALSAGVAQLAAPSDGDDLGLPADAASVTVGDVSVKRDTVVRAADGGTLPAGFEIAAPLGSEAARLLATMRRVRL